MRYLVTGCTGFVGSRLIGKFLERGHQIFCTSRANACRHGGRVVHLQQDLSEGLDYSALPVGLDGILHLAATMEKGLEPSEMFQINTYSTLDLLKYGKETGARRFILISSGAVYGYCQSPLSEESPRNPGDFYGRSKKESEVLLHQFEEGFTSAVILRLFFPYGPGQVKGIVPELVRRIKEGREITIYNERYPKINPIYVTDVVWAIEKALCLKGPYTINLCGDEILSVGELALMIGYHLGMEPVFSDAKDERISNLVGVNARMKATLGISSLILLREGIEEVVKGREK